MENENKSNMAFIVELFMMLAILILVIVVITETFVMTRGKSIRAKQLTDAVIAAQSTAEVIESSKDTEDAVRLLSGMENASDVEADAGEVRLSVKYANKTYPVSISIKEDEGKTGTYKASEIEVMEPGTDEVLYTLKTGNYEKGAEK